MVVPVILFHNSENDGFIKISYSVESVLVS